MPDDFDYSQPRPRPMQAAGTTPWLTYILIAASVLATIPVILPAGLPHALEAVLSNATQPLESIWSGQFWALITTVFVHGGVVHLAFNMLWLYQLGPLLESSIPRWKYALIVLGAAAVGSGAEILVDGQTGVGMSGVVYALFGLMWAGRGSYPAWRAVATRDNLWYLVGWGVFCIFATHFGWLSVANAAHGGGFLFGLSVGWLWFAPRRRLLWAVPLALLIVMTVLSVTYIPWSAEWRDWKMSQTQR